MTNPPAISRTTSSMMSNPAYRYAPIPFAVSLVHLPPYQRRRRCELATAWLRCGHSIEAVAKALGYSSQWEFETAYSGRMRRRCADVQKMPPLASLEPEELAAALRPSWWPARGPSRVRIPQEDFAPGISADEWARIRRECAAAELRKDAGAGDAAVTNDSEAGGGESTNDDPQTADDLAARLHPFDEIGEVAVVEFFGYVGRNGVHTPCRASKAESSCRHELLLFVTDVAGPPGR